MLFAELNPRTLLQVQNITLEPYALLRSLRLHQWSKSILVFVPLAATHHLFDKELLLLNALAFLSFCMTASSLYLINDLVDLEHDRSHPIKRERPLASGKVTRRHAGFAALTIGGFGIALAASISMAFLIWMLAYTGLVLAYTIWLKRIFPIDAILLSCFYLLRIEAGGVAVNIQPSAWLLAFASFLFFNLALLKRYQEVCAWRRQGRAWQLACPAYGTIPPARLLFIGIMSACAALLVLIFYLESNYVIPLYPRLTLLWPLPILLAGWLYWIWYRAFKGAMGDGPVLYAVRDPASLLSVSVMTVLIWLSAQPWPT